MWNARYWILDAGYLIKGLLKIYKNFSLEIIRELRGFIYLIGGFDEGRAFIGEG